MIHWIKFCSGDLRATIFNCILAENIVYGRIREPFIRASSQAEKRKFPGQILKIFLTLEQKPLHQSSKGQSTLHQRNQQRPRMNPTLIITVVNKRKKILYPFISGREWNSLHRWQNAGEKKERGRNTSVSTGGEERRNG